MLAEATIGHQSPSFQRDGMPPFQRDGMPSFQRDGMPSFQRDGMRNKRLADVKRGVDYYKKLDYIADAQWKSNVPRFPAVTRKFSSLQKITTSVLSDPDAEMRRSTVLNMTSTPRQSMSMMSATDSSITGYTPVTHSQMSLPPSLSRITHHRPFVVDSPDEKEENDNPNFNPWGTSHSALDDKTKLTPEDLKPRELPFHYRDSRKITPRPTPRKSMPMSRVASNERDRQQRTITNFRSRNGIIRVIRPLDPLPEIEKYHKNYQPEVFDVENIEREKTFMMLKRIDNILHPNKNSPRTNLGSSEEEIPGTSDSSVTVTEDNVDLKTSMNSRTMQYKHTRSPQPLSPDVTPRIDNSMRSKREKTRSSKGYPPRPRARLHDGPFNTRGRGTFSGVLHSLEISQDDPDTKCQSWIESCSKETPMHPESHKFHSSTF